MERVVNPDAAVEPPLPPLMHPWPSIALHKWCHAAQYCSLHCRLYIALHWTSNPALALHNWWTFDTALVNVLQLQLQLIKDMMIMRILNRAIITWYWTATIFQYSIPCYAWFHYCAGQPPPLSGNCHTFNWTVAINNHLPCFTSVAQRGYPQILINFTFSQ